MASPGDKVNRIQILGLMVILTVVVGQTPTVHGFNELWESSDLIVEGKILEVKVQDGEVLGIGTVSKVIKHSEMTSIYTKGLDFGSQIQVRSPEIEKGKNQRMYLEELDDNEFRVIKSEPIPEPKPSPDYGSLGYISLVIVAVSAYFLKEK